jgi:hypothetical protein
MNFPYELPNIPRAGEARFTTAFQPLSGLHLDVTAIHF